MPPKDPEYSIYLHIPFCIHRCAYCDFITYAGRGNLIPAYVKALQQEMELVLHAAGEKPIGRTIFFGGGTPTLLSIEQLRVIIQAIRGNFRLPELENLEISLETNPGSLTQESLTEIRSLGFNRISIGAQSFHLDELNLLERIHDPEDIQQAVKWARRAGFTNINLDLIYGLPEQTLGRWSTSVEKAVELGVEHLSLYALTIEPGTPFYQQVARGRISALDPDIAAEMYEWSGNYLHRNGYLQYEISNWSRPGFECQHNLTYWHARSYFGFGVGAHGYAAGIRYANTIQVSTYINHLLPPYRHFRFPYSPSAVTHKKLTNHAAMQEMMILGLRLTREGVSADVFEDRFNCRMEVVFQEEITDLINLNLLFWEEGRLCLTPRGRLLGNQVFIRFVD